MTTEARVLLVCRQEIKRWSVQNSLDRNTVAQTALYTDFGRDDISYLRALSKKRHVIVVVSGIDDIGLVAVAALHARVHVVVLAEARLVKWGIVDALQTIVRGATAGAFGVRSVFADKSGLNNNFPRLAVGKISDLPLGDGPRLMLERMLVE